MELKLEDNLIKIKFIAVGGLRGSDFEKYPTTININKVNIKTISDVEEFRLPFSNAYVGKYGYIETYSGDKFYMLQKDFEDTFNYNDRNLTVENASEGVIADIRNKLGPVVTLISLIDQGHIELNNEKYKDIFDQVVNQSKLSINYLTKKEQY